MAISKRHRILVASDGSTSAQAALATVVKFPWSSAARVRAIVSGFEWFGFESAGAKAALSNSEQVIADNARRALARRWKNPDVVVSRESAVDAILEEADKFDASMIALGWRGHGSFRRLLAGSVSRSVAGQANCSVLIVRKAPASIRRFVVAYDGCPNALRAIDFLCSLEPASGHVTLVNVVEPIAMPGGAHLIPAGARGLIRREMAEYNEKRTAEGGNALAAAVSRLKDAGWSARAELVTGAPLDQILKAAGRANADVLVLGARGVSGMERALLGSVANGALNRSPIPVLVVR
jgi:nucleotide-binding universal stress UspA family protein